MNKYKPNISDYVEEELLKEEIYKAGDEMGFLPGEEQEANFCTLESIKKTEETFSITLSIENEWTGEKYKKNYEIKKGCNLGMIMLAPNLTCFLPPERIPVLVEVTAFSLDSITFKPIGVLEEYVNNIEKK